MTPGGWTGPAECGYPACLAVVRTRLCADGLGAHAGLPWTAAGQRTCEPEPDQPGLFELAKPIDRRH